MAIFFRKTRRKLDERDEELRIIGALVEAERDQVEEARKEVAESRTEVDERRVRLDWLLANRVEAYPHIAKAWADWELVLAERDAQYLRGKRRPAPHAADVVREKGRELADARRRLKLAEYVIALYEFHFPWLTDLRDLDAERDYTESEAEGTERSQDDPASNWVSKEEWAALSEVERNQLALDRYLRSRKSNWQLGRDYERYVGYLREQEGCLVTYHGIIKGFEDLGRDILAEQNGRIEVIQCKRWAQRKTIHEKHVFQLFGTMVAAKIEYALKEITGTFVTTTSLSDRAREFADVLDIKVEENFPLADYPRIKCNVARQSGEHIYHLPFDQQYDKTAVEPARGECYAMTCAEAEAMGFRRAWRWRPEKP